MFKVRVFEYVAVIRYACVSIHNRPAVSLYPDSDVCDQLRPQVRHWLALILDSVTASKQTPGQLANLLVVLAALLHSAAASKQAIDSALLCSLADWLASEQVRSVEHAPMQRQLVMAVANLVDVAGDGAAAIGQPLLHILLHLQASRQDSYMAELVLEVRPS